MNDDTTSEPKIVRTPAKIGQSPAILKGIQPLDPREMLAQASPEQLKFLTHSNFALWAAHSGIEVDHHQFSFDDHRYLLPIYLEQGNHLVMQKSAQMGATIYVLLRLLWYARYYTVKCGLYFPTQDGVTRLSKDRLTALISSNAELYNAMQDDTDSLGLKHFNNTQGKKSSVYILHLGGVASKDSVPLDVVGFDEVRLVEQNDVDQALERISHSTYKVKMFVSTCGFPQADINRRFISGTQNYWHVKCGCKSGDGFIPSQNWPDCIVEHNKEVYIRCPKCRTRIVNPQNGQYISHNPGADYPSYHISQLISNYISPKEIWDFYQRTTNIKEFYNAKLGEPYIDEASMPMHDGVLEQCVNTDLQWAVNLGKTKGKRRFMGVDQGHSCHVVVGEITNNGKYRIIHLEVIDPTNPRYYENGKPASPFKRIAQIINDFNVDMCIVDAMPAYNEALALVRDFHRKVYVSFYSDASREMVTWGDRPKQKMSIRRGGERQKTKYHCVLNRYMSIDFMFRMITDGQVEMPHPDGLVQVIKNPFTGKLEATNICRDILWRHLKSLVRDTKVIGEEKEGRVKQQWINVGLDPHFAQALNFCLAAGERIRRAPIAIF